MHVAHFTKSTLFYGFYVHLRSHNLLTNENDDDYDDKLCC